MKRIFFAIAALSILLLGNFGSVPVLAANNMGDFCDDGKIPEDERDLAGCNLNNQKTVMPIAKVLINATLSIIGVVAVGVIVYGGFTYTTSLGDAAKTARGKNIIIYGVVGLVVAVLAWLIVGFVSQVMS